MRCPVPAFDVSLQVKSNFQGTGIVSPLDGVVQIHEKSEPHPWVLVPFMPKFVEVPRPKEKTDSKFGTLAENKAIPRGGGAQKRGGGGVCRWEGSWSYAGLVDSAIYEYYTKVASDSELECLRCVG